MVNESNCKIVLSALLRDLRGQTAHADDTYIKKLIIAPCPGIMFGELSHKSARNDMTPSSDLCKINKKIAGEKKAGIYMLDMILSRNCLFNLQFSSTWTSDEPLRDTRRVFRCCHGNCCSR